MPEIRVEAAFGSGFSTPIADRVYTDISEWVEGDLPVDIGHGRADELTTADAGSSSFTLDNSDGRFTPGRATLVDGSPNPFYPNIKKGLPIRESVIYPTGTYVRHAGYINSWPIVWPDSTDSVSTITVTSSTRRARLGQTAPLTKSPLRYAYYQPGEPQAYWPMDAAGQNPDGGEYFGDVTNTGVSAELGGALAVRTTTAALQPSFIVKRREGPVDENVDNGMLYFPSYTDSGLIGTRPHYVGAGGACRINTAGELTYEFIARLEGSPDTSSLVEFVQLQSTRQTIVIDASNDGISCGMYLYTESGGLAHYEDSALISTPALAAIANDGEIHHYAFTLTSGTAGTLYLDGAVAATVTFPPPYVFSDPFTSIAICGGTYATGAWVGHVAVRDEALSPAEILAHANGATTQDEGIEDRLQRLLGYLGVPEAEVTAEASVALPVGDQSQVGRAALDVVEELAASTGGIAYDKRDGTFTMQARNHRYNQTAAFELDASAQEIGGDLAPVLDDRYLVNYITISRVGLDETFFDSDQDSIDAYGTYTKALTMVTTSWQEAGTAAMDAKLRYAEPKIRVAVVTVDLVNLSDAQRALVLAADIGTLFTIKGLPGQAPSSSLPLYVEGYSETITATSHTLTMNTTPGDLYTNVLVLDDAAHDVLDSGIVLAY